MVRHILLRCQLLHLLYGLVSVEGAADLFQCGTLRLDEEEEYRYHLHDQERLIQEIEVPACIIDADRVDVLPEEEGKVRRKRLHHDTVGTDAVGEDFDRVGDVEGDPAFC